MPEHPGTPGLDDFAGQGILTARSTISVVMAAFVLSVGFDFFLHGGLLARLYTRESPFLLDPMTAFARIPAGYTAFLLLTGGLMLLLRRLDIRGWRDGGRVGLAVGLFVWGTMALGLWSITTAGIDTLAAWSIGQGIELGLAGMALGAGRAGTPLTRIWGRVAGAVVVFAVLTVVLQNTG